MRAQVWLAINGEELDAAGQYVELVEGEGKTLTFDVRPRPHHVIAGMKLQVVIEPERRVLERMLPPWSRNP